MNNRSQVAVLQSGACRWLKVLFTRQHRKSRMRKRGFAGEANESVAQGLLSFWRRFGERFNRVALQSFCYRESSGFSPRGRTRGHSLVQQRECLRAYCESDRGDQVSGGGF